MEPWQHHFRNIMSDGELCFDGADYDSACSFYRDAFRVIPEPKQNFSESTEAVAALADCFYFLEDFERSQAALDDVLLCPGGAANPFIRLRRGQLFHRIGDTDQARIELTAAYLNGGRDVFDGDEEYFELISDVVRSLTQK